MNVDALLARAVDAKKYASNNIKPSWIKLFMDGVLKQAQYLLSRFILTVIRVLLTGQKRIFPLLADSQIEG